MIDEYTTTTDEELISFLKSTLSDLETNRISDQERQTLSEFYLLCKFKTDYASMKEEISEEDMVKFLVLGWYIYCVLLKKPSLDQ